MRKYINLRKAEKFTASDENGFALDCIAGTRGDEYGETAYVWALFNRKDVPQNLIDDHLDPDGDYDLAYHLTSWCSYSNGVGRWFGAEPVCIIGRNHILVRQYRALDI